MKRILTQSLILTLVCMIFFGFVYPAFVTFSATIFTDKTEGTPVFIKGEIRGFENIGQKFTEDKYFNGRPSSVDYDAASSGGSNKSTTNPEYLSEVQARIDTFMAHNPDIEKDKIPSELVTASGSGIDPDISPESAFIQIPRISKMRNTDPEKLKLLISENIRKKYFGMLGKESVNVLKLNIDLDNLTN